MVALRHRGPLGATVTTLPELLRGHGYTSTCVGFSGNPSARGFDSYLDYEAWSPDGDGRAPKAHLLNETALPELDRLVAGDDPFLLFLRHMDPHSPYLPPHPYERMFYHGNECDPANRSMDPVMAFKPFRDYFAAWMPPGISDKDYVIAQYDGAVAYMDAAIAAIFNALAAHGILDDTIVVVNGDHGETLYDHECWFDHHGLYDNVLHVPLILRYPPALPSGLRVAGYNQHQDLVPTLLELAGLPVDAARFDGASLLPLVRGERHSHASELYLTECTWMRKHGWRTPQWKLIEAPGAGLSLQAAGGTVSAYRRPRRVAQPGGGDARRGGVPARAHAGVDRAALPGHRAAGADFRPGRLARPRRAGPVHLLAAGLRHPAHRRPGRRPTPAGRRGAVTGERPLPSRHAHPGQCHSTRTPAGGRR